ncbi:hypothetical protein [Mulberry dwarf phytoplasma]|uniref:hypothetical protein n=1 Tax=Mulberry dwarf phytoplasma TaxID=186171 RepID=UPI001D10AF5B|nr:hypothetical protein [Mulberry dwarf phytoplasma]
MNLLKEEKDAISKNQKTCDEHQYHLNSIQPQIENLKQPQQQLEQQLQEKEKELNRLKINRKQNEAEIDKLEDEKSEIIEKIGKIKVEIGILESEQEMYEGMLSDAIKLRDSLQRDYDKSKKQYQDNILSKLNSLYQIASAEE